jgi:uncharacterized membrane protein
MNEENQSSESPNNTNTSSSSGAGAVITDHGKNLAMAILSYIGPLVIVSYIVAKDDGFVKFHIRQGLVLFVIEVAVWFFAMLVPPLYPITMVINLLAFVLAVIGIINASKGKEKELPVVGKYSKFFPI